MACMCHWESLLTLLACNSQASVVHHISTAIYFQLQANAALRSAGCVYDKGVSVLCQISNKKTFILGAYFRLRSTAAPWCLFGNLHWTIASCLGDQSDKLHAQSIPDPPVQPTGQTELRCESGRRGVEGVPCIPCG